MIAYPMGPVARLVDRVGARISAWLDSCCAQESAPRATKPTSAAPKPTKKADVASFVEECVQPAKGSESELRWLYAAYLLYAIEKGEEPIARAEFDKAWRAIAKEVGLKMRPHGDKTIVEDVRLGA